MLPSITGKYLDTMYDEETIAVPLDSRIKPIVTPSFLLYEKQWIITLEGEVRTKERGQQVFSHPKGDLTTNRRGVGMPAISILRVTVCTQKVGWKRTKGFLPRIGRSLSEKYFM